MASEALLPVSRLFAYLLLHEFWVLAARLVLANETLANMMQAGPCKVLAYWGLPSLAAGNSWNAATVGASPS